MCVGGSPEIKLPPPPAASKPAEALKEVNADVAAARDNTNRRLAARLSLKRTQATSPLGLTNAATVTNKKLLGE